MTRRTVLAVLSAGLVVMGAGLSNARPLPVSAGAVTGFSFSPDSSGEFASRGSLAPSTQTILSVTALSSGSADPSATVFLSFTGNGAALVSTSQCPAAAPSGQLTSTPVACVTDTQGGVGIDFQTPANSNSPSTYPVGGVSMITAQNAAVSPSVTKSEKYYWSTVTQYAWSQQPIAEPGTLSPPSPTAGVATFSVIPEDANSNAVSTAGGVTEAIYLTFAGAGSAFASSSSSGATVCGTGTQLKSSQKRFDIDTTSGSVNLCYIPPATMPSGTATITAADDDNFPVVASNDYYNANTNQTLTSQTVSPTAPIAAGGSLQTGQPKPITVTAFDAASGGGNPIPYVTVYLCLCPANTGTGAFTAQSWTDNGRQRQLTATPQGFVTDAHGQVSVTYTAGSGTTGTDFFTSQDTSTGSGTASKSVQDYYTYASATHYKFSSPWTPSSPYLAARGSLDHQASPAAVPITVTALDAGDNPVPFTSVFLSFAQTFAGTAGGTATEGTAASPPALTSTPTSYSTDTAGNIVVNYKPPAETNNTPTPVGGQDVVTAANNDVSPTIVATDAYIFGKAVDYSVNPTPIATAGSLHANDIVPVTFHVANDSDQSPAGNALVYVILNPASGSTSSASAPQCSPNTIPTSGTPAACTTDTNGNLLVDYQAPSSLPASGTDSLVATDASTSPFETLSDKYSFIGYSFSPSPIAATGSLTSNATVPVTLTIVQGGAQVSGGSVWLSFTPASGSTASAAVGTTALTATPTKFTANGSGQILLAYKRAAVAPIGGTDLLRAQDAASSPTVTSQDGYSYLGQFGLLPAGPKIAPDGTIPANTLRVVTVTAKDSQGATAVGAKLYASFTRATNGGSASINGVPLTSTPAQFTATDGTVTIDYTTPSTLPTKGTDIVTLQNESSSPTLVTGDTYTFLPPPPPPHGYWLVASDGGIFPFGNAGGFGSTGGMHLNQPIVGMAVTPDHGGYFLVAADGGIFPFGDAIGRGSTGNMHLNKPIVGMAVTPSGKGYWLVAADGGIFPFGDAVGRGSTGSMHLNAPIVGMAATSDGGGYWLVASDGGIFPFGDAVGRGSTGNMHLNQPIVGMAPTPSGNGYYLVASDGGIFPFGDAVGRGSTGNMHLNQPIVGMAVMPDNGGYWLVASDGGIFPFGDAPGYGSEGGSHLNQPIVGMAAD